MAVGFPDISTFQNIDLKSLTKTNQPRQKPLDALGQIAQTGFGPGQLELLIQQLTQQLGTAQGQERGILGQQLAGAPRGVQQSALASSQNKFLGALQKGTTGIQGAGMDRQMQALLALLQQQMQQQRLKQQKESQLLGNLLGIAIPGGELLFDLLGKKN